MKATIATNKLLALVKSIIFIALATISVGASAMETMYVGNPSRENTIWVPGHCRHGVWMNGFYVKIDHNMPVPVRDMKWVGDRYDRCGNFVPAHWWYKPLYRCYYIDRCGYWHRCPCAYRWRHHHYKHHHHKHHNS